MQSFGQSFRQMIRWSQVWIFRVCILAGGLVSAAGDPLNGGITNVWAEALEPAYCDPNTFDEKEVYLGEGDKLDEKGLPRAHTFKLGKTTLVGVGVGNGKVSALQDLAKQFSRELEQKDNSEKGNLGENQVDRKSCTFYLNHPSNPKDERRVQAASHFNQKDIPRSPVKLTEEEVSKEFLKVLEKTFDQEPVSFLSCAENEGYIALGCNNMMHRGPTVFGMLLAFSGCTPKHALEIANQTWGLNGVKRKVRLAAIESAYKLGEARKESRKKLRDLFSGD